MRNIWRIAGLIVGIALAAAAMLAPQAALDGLVTTLGLNRLTPLAQPPLGHTARLALAVLGLVLGLLLAFVLGRLTRRPAEDPYANNDPLETRREPGSRPPPVTMPISEMPVSSSQSMPLGGIIAEPVIAGFAVAQPETSEATYSMPEPAEFDDPPSVAHETVATRSEPEAAPETASLYAGGPITVTPEPITVPPAERVGPIRSSSTEAATDGSATNPAITATLARLEAALADLKHHGPAHVGSRLDAIDARMGQIAQQIAELAGLARAAARTPLPMSVPAPAAPTHLRAPANSDRRQSIGTAARALLDRMDRDAI